MARSTADFNQRLVDEVSRRVPSPAVVAELGFGPGVGLAAILTRFPAAQVYGVDPSAAVQAQALARNSSAARGGRLRLLPGEARALLPFRPLDLVVAVHVLYFWIDPVGSLVQVNGLLSPRGHVALGYQLKQHLPSQAQRDFPKEGHRLYESDEEVTAVLVQAGLTPHEVVVIGPSESPLGRVLIAAAPQRGG